MWDDPKENSAFFEYVKKEKTVFNKVVAMIIRDKTYCQCWSLLSESDAMWRIYSYDNKAIQLKTSFEKIKMLDNIDIVPVLYSDDLVVDVTHDKKDVLLKSFGVKRVAFEHEKEVRLVNHYRFNDFEDCEKQVRAFLAMHQHPNMVEIFESLDCGETIEERVKKCAELLNLGNSKKTTKKISFKDVPNFIEGVKVHPLAPDWYVEIVNEYCRRNDIDFNGRSELYLP